MAFREIPGVTGKVYVPDDSVDKPEGKKHNCPDCRFCQWCSDSRCAMCLNRRNCDPKLKKGECK